MPTATVIYPTVRPQATSITPSDADTVREYMEAAQEAQAAAEAARDEAINAIPPSFVDTIAELKALDTGSVANAYLRDEQYEGQYILRTGDYSAIEDGYSVIEADDAAITTKAWVKKFNRPPTPQDFGMATGELASPDGVNRCVDYAARETGEMLFNAVYYPSGPIEIVGNMSYLATRNSRIDGSLANIGAFNDEDDYLNGIVTAVGKSVGSAIALDADIVSQSAASVNGNITRTSTTATINTYGPHGLTSNDFADVLFGGGYSAGIASLMPYLTQAQSSEQMPLTTPVQVTRISDTQFTYTVSGSATTPVSGSSVYVVKNNRMLKTVSAHSLAAGDWVELNTNVNVEVLTGSQTIKAAEKLRVARVIDSTTAILQGQVKYDHLVSNGATMRKLTMIERIYIENMHITGRGSTGTTNVDGENGIALDLVEEVISDGLRVDNCEQFGVSLQRYGRAVFDNFSSRATFTDDAGRVSGVTKTPYAFCYGGHGNSLVMNAPWVEGPWRHSFAEATPGANPGVTDIVEINNPHFVGALSNCIATHFPCDGYTIRGGLLSGNDFGMDIRCGKLLATGVKGRGGNGLATIYGHLNDIVMENCQHDNGMNAAVLISGSSSGSSTKRPTIKLRNIRGNNVRRVVDASLSSAAFTRMDIDDILGENIEFEAVNVSFDSTNKGHLRVGRVDADNVYRGTSGTAVSVRIANASRLELRGLDATKSSISSALAQYSMTGCEDTSISLVNGQQIDQVTISSGAITLQRGDDHTLVVRGEGSTADNLDQIIGGKPGQEITLVRYSETITVRDSATSSVAYDAGAFQTPSGSSITLDSSYKHIIVKMLGTGSYSVVSTVATSV